MKPHSYIHVKLKDGSWKAIKTDNVEQMFLDKETEDIIVWCKENNKIISAPMSDWERKVK